MKRMLLACALLCLPALVSAQPTPVGVLMPDQPGVIFPAGGSSGPFADIVFTGQALGPDSCAAYSFSSAPTTGYGFNGAALCRQLAGVVISTAASTGETWTIPILFADGAVGAPALAPASDPDTGFYWTSAGALLMAINGVLTHQWGNTYYANSSNSACLQFGAAGDVTICRAAGPLWNIAVSGVTRATINSSGMLLPNLTSGRVPIAAAGGLVTDDAGLTYSVSSDAMSFLGDAAVTDYRPLILKSASGMDDVGDAVGIQFNAGVTEVATIRAYTEGPGQVGIRFGPYQASGWDLQSAGHWVPVADNLRDVGSSSFGVRTGYFGTSLFSPTIYGSSAANGDIRIRGTSSATETSALATVTNYVSRGDAPTVANVGANSCGTTAATIAGNSNAGIITVGETAGTQCRVTFPFAAPTRWQCMANNETVGNLTRTTAVDTTNVDFAGTFGGGDVVAYICVPR